MTVQSACQALPKAVATKANAVKANAVRVLPTASLRRPNCPRCGSLLLIAEESRFNAQACVGDWRIDHDWSCDDCGHKFATSVRLGRR